MLKCLGFLLFPFSIVLFQLFLQYYFEEIESFIS